MKSVRILFIVFIFVVSILSLFSCMKGDDYKNQNAFYVTVEDGALGSGKRLLVDNSDIVLIPSYSSLQTFDNLDGIERMIVVFTLQDDVIIDETTKQWPIDIVGGSVINTKSFSNRPDTLSDDAIYQIDKMWSSHKHINVTYSTYGLIPNANMVQEKIGGDTLYLRLYYDLKNGGSNYAYLNSFRLPAKYQLEDIETKQDSIVVAVAANIKSGSSGEIKYKYVKYKPY